MAGKHTYNCAHCGIEKREVNHWMLAWFIGPHGEPEFSVRGWDEEIARLDDDAMPVCGQAHSHQLLDRFFATAEKESAAPPATPECPVDPPAEAQFQAGRGIPPRPLSTYPPLPPSPDTEPQAGTAESAPSLAQAPAVQPAPASADAAGQPSTTIRQGSDLLTGIS